MAAGMGWKALVALAMVSSPSIVSAQSCYSLRSELRSVNQQGEDLAGYEWGSALVLGGCLAVGMDNYQRTGSQSDAVGVVLVCAGAGCGLTTSYSNCLSVVSRLFLLALNAQLLEQRIRDRC